MGITTFNQPVVYDDEVDLRVHLDSSSEGLSPKRFRAMFGQCEGCYRYMIVWTKDHHKCPGKYALPQLVSDRHLFDLLDSTTGGKGLTTNQFHNLFFSCIICGHVFTRFTASHHHTHFE